MSHKIKVQGNVMAIEVDPNADMGALNDLMSAAQDGWVREQQDIARKFSVSDGTAASIWYLRTRSRWTQDLENQLIAADHAGKPIDGGAVLSGEWPEDHVSPLKEIVKEVSNG